MQGMVKANLEMTKDEPKSESERIECSVWSNGANGHGLRILGGLNIRRQHFDRSQSPIQVEIDGQFMNFNIDKNSFWSLKCGELIGKPLGSWFAAQNLRTGDHVSLEVIESKKLFRLIR